MRPDSSSGRAVHQGEPGWPEGHEGRSARIARIPGITPPDVTGLARQGEPLATRTVDMFLALLGNVAGNLALTVGATTKAETFLTAQTLGIIVLGLTAFGFGTAGGVLLGKLMYVLTKGKVNPLIGAAGVSAVPMAARVVQKVGQKENPSNFLLMHAMGPNVAGVIGSAVVAGMLLALLS